MKNNTNAEKPLEYQQNQRNERLHTSDAHTGEDPKCLEMK